MMGITCLGASKAPLQFTLRQPHDRRTAVHVVRWQRAGKEAIQQISHFRLLEFLTGLDRRSAGVCCGKPLQSVQAAEPSARQIRHQLLETPARIESSGEGWAPRE